MKRNTTIARRRGGVTMNFIEPGFLYLAPVATLAVIALAIIASKRRRAMLRFLLGNSADDPDAVKLSRTRRGIRHLLLLLAMVLLLIAAARPFWNSQLLPYQARGRDVMVLFDVSKSMLASDLAPSRLKHAKFLLRKLISDSRGD